MIRASEFSEHGLPPMYDAWLDLDSVMMVRPPSSESQIPYSCEIVLNTGYRGQFPLGAERLVGLIETYERGTE